MSRFVKEIPEKYLYIENHCDKKGNNSFGEENISQSSRFDFRASARAALKMYGSGNTSDYKSAKRVAIDGNSGNSMGSTSYGKPSYARTTTNYGGVKGSTSYSTKSSYSSASTIRNTANAVPNKKVGFGKEFPMDIFDIKKPAKAVEVSNSELGYEVGDTVVHELFGIGKVKLIEPSPRDYKVTVEFENDNFGTKKMLAGFAKLKKQ